MTPTGGEPDAPVAMRANRIRAVLSLTGALLTIAYPVAVYIGLTSWSTRGVTLVLLVFLLPILALRAYRTGGQSRAELFLLPVAVVTLLALSWLLDDRRFVLVLPVLVNGVLLTGFAVTLRRGVPLVERFARLQRDDLSEAEIRYCRTVTIAWCGFFLVNGALTAILAIAGPLDWWALYTGLLSYVLIGAMFTVEYLVRSYRFRHYGARLHARVVARIFPPR